MHITSAGSRVILLHTVDLVEIHMIACFEYERQFRDAQ